MDNLGKKILSFLSENSRIILVGVISVLMVIAAAIVLSLYFGGDVTRKLTVAEISGSAYIERNGTKVTAAPKSKIQNGDIVSTGENSSVRLSLDGDKYIWIEPDSQVYINFTDVASKGDISVNLTKGSVICQLNNKLRGSASFSLKTPNSTVSVKGTVFRTSFDYVSEYQGYKNVMITQIQNFEGTVELQLYDLDKQPVEEPMLLIERTAAQLVTGEEVCKYGYLNYSFDLLTLTEQTIGELIKIRTEKELAFTPEEINSAYRIVRAEREERERQETATEPVTEDTSGTAVTTETTTVAETETTVTAPPETETETEDTTTYGTLNTTLQTYEYTTYSGIKWWESTGNTNTGTEGYEDWFTEPEDFEPETAETTVPTETGNN